MSYSRGLTLGALSQWKSMPGAGRVCNQPTDRLGDQARKQGSVYGHELAPLKPNGFNRKMFARMALLPVPSIDHFRLSGLALGEGASRPLERGAGQRIEQFGPHCRTTK